ncbi:NAD-dependent epimerase/dehydratase family protein [Sphaerisporangium sp. TRM90804]|uniref:NAD-dependent epimerase/dehydratase family protein n=1 Tax=Sphaerisporangium sp. TRM90804 TaxID=3031113 RepID=UPI00244A7A5F|nr:NAD-dependent epimerase/dehydratase family protein [Sphaerisporangium sp. TRM90804]MDH2424139.1 NAD-dependent epimerase/dehydratase family protein [Sphaerisporangium sp. TRM90804]
MKIVVTGGAGFIGANLCGELSRRPEVSQVVVLDDLSSGRAENLQGTGADIVKGSILDRPLLEDTLAGAAAVVHLAARPSVAMSVADPEGCHEVNATGTLRVLEACRLAGAYAVVASSCAVYGDRPDNPKHEDLPALPLSPYGAGKLATEAYAQAYAASFGMRTLALRFFNVYGPFQAADHVYAAVIPAFADRALRGEPLLIHGDGLQTRDFTYVGTVVRVLADAVLRQVVSDAPVNVAQGSRTSLLELAAEFGRILDRPLPVEHLPAREGDIRDSRASCERLHRLFPDLERVPLETGLRRTLSWFRRSAAEEARA